MKRCPRCHELKSLAAFGVRTNGKPQHWCRTCHCAYQRHYYEERKKYYAELQAHRVKRNRAMIREAKNAPCADCGLSFPYYVMDFDHRPGEIKDFALANVTTQTRISGERIRAEIAKCDVVCANCHRIRTWMRQHASAMESKAAVAQG
jgi:hypothetical protein